jgi:hypothetical protein
MPSELNDYLRPTSLLQAVNVLLESISGTPVASLDTADTNSDALKAINTIGEVNREVQTEGWNWNQDLDLYIDPDGDGQIILPENTVRFVQRYTPDTYRKRLIVRNGKLYDTINHTFTIGVEVKGDVTYIIDFEELPEAARQFVTLKAARRFSTGKLTSGTAYQVTKADEDAARLRMEQEAQETDPDSMNENPHILRMRRRRHGGLHW